MKKIRLLFIAFGLLLTVISNGQTSLTFRMANPKINYYDGFGNYLNFDIEVKASNPGTFMWSGQAMIDVNSSVLSTTVTDWSVTGKPLISGTYTNPAPPFDTGNKFNPLVTSLIGGIFNIGWTANVNVVNKEANSTFFNEVSTSWQPIVNITAKITGAISNVSGAAFFPQSMLLQQFHHTAPNTNVNYSVAFSNDISNLYVGRIYSNVNGWTQANSVSVDWDASVNSSVWDGTPTLPGGTGLTASALRVHEAATLTIPADGKLSVSGETDVVTTNGLNILSDATGTGSLITGTATGTASVQRWMTAGAWHIVSSPVEQTVVDFLTSNADIATKDVTRRGMMEYEPATNAWSDFFTNGTAGNVGSGKGFSMRVGGSDAAVTFAGTLQAGAVPASTDAGYWNCIGNPYTSAIGIADDSESTSSFLAVNASNFEPSYGAIYIWNEPDASNGLTGNYTVVSNTDPAFTDVQQGQAFMVNAATGVGSFNFTPAMQTHVPALELKSSENSLPTIKLEATVGEQKSSTLIAFRSEMTKGLDPTYDAGLLKGATDLLVYTKLVEDNGIPFAVQALPANDFSNMIIPVGLDFKTGGDVVFSSVLTDLPLDCKVILEDKQNNIFTDLTKDVYSVSVEANSIITDRFQLHTSSATTGVTMEGFEENLSAYVGRNNELRITGNVSNKSMATLYDIQGRVILKENLVEGNLNIVQTQNIRTGIYLLHVNDNSKLRTFKVVIKK